MYWRFQFKQIQCAGVSLKKNTVKTEVDRAQQDLYEHSLLYLAAVTQILTVLEAMRKEQREIKRMITQTHLLVGPGETLQEELSEGVSFPVASVD